MTEDAVTAQILNCFNPDNKQSLTPALQQIQSAKKYLSRNDLELTAAFFGIGLCKIYSIASFCPDFILDQPGKYHIRLCRGTTCHFTGIREITEMLRKEFCLEDGACSADGLFSLSLCNCLGLCGNAPNVMINGTVFSRMSPEKLRNVMNQLIRKEQKNAL